MTIVLQQAPDGPEQNPEPEKTPGSKRAAEYRPNPKLACNSWLQPYIRRVP
jgi:hypothetical protein